MRRSLIAGTLGLLLLTGGALADSFEATGTLAKVDADKGVLIIRANGQDHTARAARDIKILGLDGKELADGLRQGAQGRHRGEGHRRKQRRRAGDPGDPSGQ